jgi:hypothetical protein
LQTPTLDENDGVDRTRRRVARPIRGPQRLWQQRRGRNAIPARPQTESADFGDAFYFGNYSRHSDWRVRAGSVDQYPAVLFFGAADAERPTHFALIDWHAENVVHIRDFRYARYVLDGAEVIVRTSAVRGSDNALSASSGSC